MKSVELSPRQKGQLNWVTFPLPGGHVTFKGAPSYLMCSTADIHITRSCVLYEYIGRISELFTPASRAHPGAESMLHFFWEKLSPKSSTSSRSAIWERVWASTKATLDGHRVQAQAGLSRFIDRTLVDIHTAFPSWFLVCQRAGWLGGWICAWVRAWQNTAVSHNKRMRGETCETARETCDCVTKPPLSLIWCCTTDELRFKSPNPHAKLRNFPLITSVYCCKPR